MSRRRASADRPNIVVLCCDGVYQRYLVRRLHEAYGVSGVVVHRPPNAKGSVWERLQRYMDPARLGRYLVARWDMARAAREAAPLVETLFGPGGALAAFPAGIDVETVEDINAPQAVDFVARHAPDVVCVNGTNLLRGPMLVLQPEFPLGFINLHTGLSPYTRGGNCNLFALLEGHPEWVGVTAHHIDPGIDSGDLIITAQVPMSEGDNYDMIDARTFRLGADVMETAVRQLVDGRAERVPQWQKGRLYLKRTGFVYEPYYRYRVNRLLKRGLVRSYLADKEARDAGVRLVGAVH